MATEVTASALFAGPDRGTLENVILRHDNGLITSIDPSPAPPPSPRTLHHPRLSQRPRPRPADRVVVRRRRHAAGELDHPRPRSARRPIPISPRPPPWRASAQAGCGAMMIHYTRPSGTMPLVEEARQIARAANDVGIRIAFALAVRDQNPVVYGDSEPVLSSLSAERPQDRRGHVRPAGDVAARLHQTDRNHRRRKSQAPGSTCSSAPPACNGARAPLLEAIAESSARTGRRVHMHLLETIYQRAWADAHFPDGIVRYLRDIGLLSNRLTLAHCIHARPDELEIIAASGARIVTNFSSNLHLHSGLAPIAAAHRCGCAIAVGVDGLALDEDDDVIREMRLVQLAHGGIGFKRTWTRPEFLSLAIRNGRAATGAPGNGELAPGAAADFVVLDLDRLDRDAHHAGRPAGTAVRARQRLAGARRRGRRADHRARRASRPASTLRRSSGVARDVSGRRQTVRPARTGLGTAFSVARPLVRSAMDLRLRRSLDQNEGGSDEANPALRHS